MRRITWPPPREKDLWRFRVLGAIIPDLDHIIAEYQEHLPTPAKPILPLHLRPALLAGIAIVERAGPEMLRMLRGHMMGDNRVKFTDAAENIIARARRSRASSQMQLIWRIRPSLFSQLNAKPRPNRRILTINCPATPKTASK